jgi:hypothetical protein
MDFDQTTPGLSQAGECIQKISMLRATRFFNDQMTGKDRLLLSSAAAFRSARAAAF